MAKGTCSVDECGRVEQLRKGLCQKHYVRLKVSGTTDNSYYHCPKNHRLSPDNVGTDPHGKRFCIACRDAKPVEICVIEECSDPVLARGWCGKHYQRWKKLGSTGTPPRFVPKICTVDDCETQAIKHGLCSKHFARWKKRGTTDDPPPKPTECAVEGCDSAPRCRGWCKRHYKQLTGQGSAHEMKRYAQKLGSQVEQVDYERILAEFGMVCHLCRGEIATLADLNMDHVIPLSRGGPHTYENIRPSHKRCNQSKGAKILTLT